MSKQTALLAGATGLVGKHLLEILLNSDDFNQITVIGRNPIEIDDERVNQVIIKNFDYLHEYESLFDVNHVFCCLGTNMRSPGSREIFRKVNLDYPLKMALLAKNKPTFKVFHVVTSVGASKKASNYYSTVKGHLEMALQRKNLPGLKIYRPSLLKGKRSNPSLREEFMKFVVLMLSFLVIKRQQLGPSTIQAKTVAEAMYHVAIMDEPEFEIFRPRDMVTLVEGAPMVAS
jgi:uncharacterized protein YbjT (DUF2867 family)